MSVYLNTAFHAVLASLSEGYPPLEGRSPTRYSPVCHATNPLRGLRDQDLVILVSIGGWIRGTQVVSGSVAANYDERSAKLLRQPALVSFIHSKLNDVSPELRTDPLVKSVNDQLTNLEKLVTFPAGKSPSPDDVRKVNSVVTDFNSANSTQDRHKMRRGLFFIMLLVIAGARVSGRYGCGSECSKECAGRGRRIY